jgi:adenylate cyclase
VDWSSREGFASEVLAAYRNAERGVIKASTGGPGYGVPTGHPIGRTLALGESRSVELASLFFDLDEFTARTFWSDQDETVRLAHAVLSGVAEVVSATGGYVAGLRGDGLYAVFGPNEDVFCTVHASACGALALDLVQNGLNPMLERAGIDPVRAAVGADFGLVSLVRSGDSVRSTLSDFQRISRRSARKRRSHGSSLSGRRSRIELATRT